MIQEDLVHYTFFASLVKKVVTWFQVSRDQAVWRFLQDSTKNCIHHSEHCQTSATCLVVLWWWWPEVEDDSLETAELARVAWPGPSSSSGWARGSLFVWPDCWLLASAANDPSVSQSVFTITEKAPTRVFSWLKTPTSAFTFNLSHY